MESDVLCEFKDPSSKAVTIVFSEFLPADRGTRSFSFRHLLSNIPANVLYAKDRYNQWYARGIHGIGDDVASAAAALREIVRGAGFDEIRCLGTSMGGYAALMFGRELNADAILAFAPQTFFAPPYPRFVEGVHDGNHLDLAAFTSPPAARTRIVIAQDELFDVYGALRLPYRHRVDLKILRFANHLVARALTDAGTFKDILVDFVRSGEHRDLGVELTEIDFAPLRDDLLAAVDAVYHGDEGRALEILRPVVERTPTWAGAHWWLARAFAVRKDHERAARHLETAFALNSVLYEVASDAVEVKAALQDWRGMLHYAMRAWELNRIFLDLRENAIAVALEAVSSLRTAGRIPEARELLGELDEIFRRPDFADHPLRQRVAASGSELRLADTAGHSSEEA